MQYFSAKINNPLSLITCGHFISPGNWTHSRRVIDSYEIIIGLKGALYIKQDNERFVVHPGNVLLLLPDRCHEGYAPCSRDTSFYWLHFNCKNPSSVIEQADVEFMKQQIQSSCYSDVFNENVLVPTFSAPESIEKVIIQFKQLLHITNSQYYTRYAADYLMTSILIELSQQVTYNYLQTDSHICENESKLTNILEWIRINIQNDISIDEIAYEFGFNKNYLSRLFKKHFGVSVKSYIILMKVSKAKELLCRSDKSIKEIAYWLGFNDEKYFMKLFKEHEQLTPTEYRKAFYKTHLNNS